MAGHVASRQDHAAVGPEAVRVAQTVSGQQADDVETGSEANRGKAPDYMRAETGADVPARLL
jgi:hypothetical protein